MITKRKLRVQKFDPSLYATPAKSVAEVIGLPSRIRGRWVKFLTPAQARALERKELNQWAGPTAGVGPNPARREKMLALVEKLQSPERTEFLDKIYKKFARAF